MLKSRSSCQTRTEGADLLLLVSLTRTVLADVREVHST